MSRSSDLKEDGWDFVLAMDELIAALEWTQGGARCAWEDSNPDRRLRRPLLFH